MRRQLTDKRARLHKNTHNWARLRYRKIITGRIHGDLATGRRSRVVTVNAQLRTA